MKSHPDPVEERIADWLRSAPPRPEPSAQARARAQAAAQARWRELLRTRKAASRRVFAGWAAVAAAAAIATGAWLLWPRAVEGPAPGVVFGTVEHLAGIARAAQAGEPARMLAAGTGLVHGMEVMTGDGRLAAAVPGGLSLRLDRYTRLRIEGSERLTLLEGSVYVDTGSTAGSRRLRITSPAGVIEHVGTQYRVTVRGSATRIAVREGALRLERRGETPAEPLFVTRGRQLELSRGRDPSWSSLSAHDASWAWAAEAAAPIRIDGRSVRAFLDWICREYGWRWEAGAGFEAGELDAILLRGSIEGLAPQDALALVAAISELSIALDADAGKITVSRTSRDTSA